MEVKVAKSAGFCFGVMRAVDQVYAQVKQVKDVPIYTYGPIIHNEIVVKDLEQKGVVVIQKEEDIKQYPKGVVIIRSHGVSRAVAEKLEACGHRIVDATCPFVKKIHHTVDERSRRGEHIIIAGNRLHPEVTGIVGWSNSPVDVIESVEELKKLAIDPQKKACIVAQTTFNYNKFKNIVDFVREMSYDIDIVNTICNATQERQLEAEKVASQVDCMLVIGGRHSSNTQKLYEICRNVCKNTYFLQTVADIDPTWFESTASVGITAGASTPNNIIEEVQTHVRVEF